MRDDNQEITYAANEAIFGMQLNRDQAVDFVFRNAHILVRVDRRAAEQAVDEALYSFRSACGG